MWMPLRAVLEVPSLIWEPEDHSGYMIRLGASLQDITISIWDVVRDLLDEPEEHWCYAAVPPKTRSLAILLPQLQQRNAHAGTSASEKREGIGT